MKKSDDILEAYWKAMQELIGSESSTMDFKMMSAVSERFLAEYKLLQNSGLPGQTVALAMLGATVNMYRVLGMEDMLPIMLRELADHLDASGQPH